MSEHSEVEALLTGRRLIAAIYGPQPDERSWRLASRKFYRLVHHCELPAFRLNGRQFAARPAKLAAWIEDRERAGVESLKAA